MVEGTENFLVQLAGDDDLTRGVLDSGNCTLKQLGVRIARVWTSAIFTMAWPYSHSRLRAPPARTVSGQGEPRPRKDTSGAVVPRLVVSATVPEFASEQSSALASLEARLRWLQCGHRQCSHQSSWQCRCAALADALPSRHGQVHRTDDPPRYFPDG